MRLNALKRIGILFLAGAMSAALCLGCSDRNAAMRVQGGENGNDTAAQVQDGPSPEEAARIEKEEKLLKEALELGDDFAYVTEGIDLAAPQKLGFLHPMEDITTGAASYYLTGTSDPAQELLLDNAAIEGRGANGSFAMVVPLSEGDNTFLFRQGEVEKRLTIRRDAAVALPTTSVITKAAPEDDRAVKSGETYVLSCVAPSGATVTAHVNGEKVPLKQNAATAVAGIAANFSAQYTMPDATGTKKLGTIEYPLEWDGKESTFESAGALYAVGSESTLAVQIKNESSVVFETDSMDSACIATAKKGAIGAVTAYSGGMYQLRAGGWIQAAAATPLTESTETEMQVKSATFSSGDGWELLTLRGGAHPFYLAEQTEESLVVRFYQTSGIEAVEIQESTIFSAASAKQQEADTVLTFTMKEPGALWGYLVEYRDGETLLYFKKKPVVGKEGQPLAGLKVAVDAGHGGTDVGTMGISYDKSPMEKDVTIAAANALERKLKFLGAEVIMVRRGDENPTMNERMEAANDNWADFYISLHANGAGYTESAVQASGVEVYYYEPGAAQLAQTLSDGICERTGRKNRGAKQSYYRVTMNSLMPAVLVEMGFLPNAEEYDELCSEQGIYDTVSAISDGLMAVLNKPVEIG